MAKKISQYPRHIQPLLIEALKDSPSVLIHGPRQCGKTTLAQMLSKLKGYRYISFDDVTAMDATISDPIGFVKGLPKRVILDEIQRVPHIFSTLKSVIDNDRVRGRFILTGSANILKMPKLSDSLAGRMQILRLHPLSRGEYLGYKSRFLDLLFKGKFRNQQSESLPQSFIKNIVMGGFPVALNLPTERRRSNWYQSYMDIIVQRDILDFSQIRSIEILPRLLALSAHQTGQLLNINRLSSAFQVSRMTIHDYMTLLERLFFLVKLPPWYSHHRANRLVKTPKIHLGDSGLACAVLHLNSKSLTRHRPLMGQILETYVFQELQRQASYHKQRHDFFYYRDKKGFEVDIVIEREHLISGVEVKLASTVTSSDFKGLHVLKKVAGQRFVCGVVLYNGELCTRFGQGFYAVPLKFL